MHHCFTASAVTPPAISRAMSFSRSGSGIARTVTRATPGIAPTTRSSSFGKMLKPLRVNMGFNKPGERDAAVGVHRAAVAGVEPAVVDAQAGGAVGDVAGRRRSPRERRISPSSIATSTPGKGTPSVPGRLGSDRRLKRQTGPASVRP